MRRYKPMKDYRESSVIKNLRKGSVEKNIAIPGVKDKDVYSIIEEYNILADSIAPSRFKKVEERPGLAKARKFWSGFESLVKFLQDNKYDSIDYLKSAIKHIVSWKLNPSKPIWPSAVIGPKMRERYVGLSYKTVEVKIEPKKLDQETEDYIEMIKRKVKKGWGEEKGNLIIKYHLKDWEENIRETNRRIAL